MKTLSLSIVAILIICMFSISIPSVFANQLSVTDSAFYSENGTELLALKLHEKVNIVFIAKTNDTSFDGYVSYSIIDVKRNNSTSNSENFTGKESPRTFTFSYTPDKTGFFAISDAMTSNSGDLHSVASHGFIVLEKFSKAMKLNGQCKNPNYHPMANPDFSINACVKLDTYFILKQRGWH